MPFFVLWTPFGATGGGPRPMLPKSNTSIQEAVRSVDGKGMKDTRQIHRDLVAGLQSLDLVEHSIRHLPAVERKALVEQVARLRGSMARFVERTVSDRSTEPDIECSPQDGFTHRAKEALRATARQARARGIQLSCQFSPALRTIPFSVGGPVLLGLVEQALAAPVPTGTDRHLSVTATIDPQQRLVIGIEDSAHGGRECYSIRDLGRWRQRIGELGGELLLRGVPFGTGTTIRALLPVPNQAA